MMWKNFMVLKLPDIDPIMEVVRGLCKTSSVWALLEWSLQWLDFWIIRQTAHIVTSTVYGAEANTDKFDSHASVSAKTLVTRSLANWAIRAMETVSALPRWQARWEAGSTQPSWDAPEGRALSSQISDNGKTSPWLGLCSLYSCISKTLPKNVRAEFHKNQAKASPTKSISKHLRISKTFAKGILLVNGTLLALLLTCNINNPSCSSWGTGFCLRQTWMHSITWI